MSLAIHLSLTATARINTRSKDNMIWIKREIENTPVIAWALLVSESTIASFYSHIRISM